MSASTKDIKKENLFTCEVCFKSFSSHYHLKRHLLIHSKNKTFIGKQFSSEKSNPRKDLHTECCGCDACAESCSHPISSEEKPFMCEMCSKGFSHRHNLERHQRKVHSLLFPTTTTLCEEYIKEKPIMCEICSKRFSHKYSLDRHQRKVHNLRLPATTTLCEEDVKEKPVMCEICSKGFSHKYNLDRHQRKVHNLLLPTTATLCEEDTKEKPFTCEICCKAFSRKDHLRRHQRNVHPETETVNDSNKYSKIYSRISDLKKFLNICDEDIKRFTCNICLKEFPDDDLLKRHQIIHNTKPAFTCEVCLRVFSENYHLKRHQASHTKEKKYACKTCRKKFSRSDHLKRHQRCSHPKRWDDSDEDSEDFSERMDF